MFIPNVNSCNGSSFKKKTGIANNLGILVEDFYPEKVVGLENEVIFEVV